MGLRYRKSIKIAKGVRLNIGKKSIGISAGNKYGGLSVNSRTGTRARISAPGTGLSYSEKIGGSQKTKPKLYDSIKATEKNTVPVKVYPRFVKKICYAISAIIAAFGLLIAIADIWVSLFFLISAGFIFLATKSMKTKDDVTNNTSTECRKSAGERTLEVETFNAAGPYYYKDNIMKLAVSNDQWRSTTKTLLANGKAGKQIYRYNFINKPVKLVPEPQNEHDKNAVMIQIAGEKVGYIPADQAVHVKKILSDKEIKYISSFIGGGEYKIPLEDGTMRKFEDEISIKVRIGYVK